MDLKRIRRLRRRRLPKWKCGRIGRGRWQSVASLWVSRTGSEFSAESERGRGRRREAASASGGRHARPGAFGLQSGAEHFGTIATIGNQHGCAWQGIVHETRSLVVHPVFRDQHAIEATCHSRSRGTKQLLAEHIKTLPFCAHDKFSHTVLSNTLHFS